MQDCVHFSCGLPAPRGWQANDKPISSVWRTASGTIELPQDAEVNANLNMRMVMTKTEAVSKLLDKEPTISAKDAVVALKKKGVEINEQGFYNYKNLWKKSRAETSGA